MNPTFLEFEVPEFQDSIIKVIGVGGGGGNATNFMYRMGIREVDFIVCNTDAQALKSSPVPVKVQLGETLTEGRGAGNKPEVGRNAAIESEAHISGILASNTRMVFITAGMGGGTGTGAAPVIARIARSLGILTVGVVTLPFAFEGKARIQQAIQGVSEMEKYVDSLLVIKNESLKSIYGDLFLGEAFSKADEVLATAVKGIAEIITVPGHVNVDFADVQTVMANSGVALMGSAVAAGDNRALHAIKMALNSPLLNSNDIRGAANILLNVTSGTEEFRVDELGEITDFMQDMVGRDAQIIWGNGIDLSLDDRIRVIVVATGFRKTDIHEGFIIHEERKEEPQVVVYPKGFEPPVSEKVVLRLEEEARESVLIPLLNSPVLISSESDPSPEVEQMVPVTDLQFSTDSVEWETPVQEEKVPEPVIELEWVNTKDVAPVVPQAPVKVDKSGQISLFAETETIVAVQDRDKKKEEKAVKKNKEKVTEKKTGGLRQRLRNVVEATRKISFTFTESDS